MKSIAHPLTSLVAAMQNPLQMEYRKPKAICEKSVVPESESSCAKSCEFAKKAEGSRKVATEVSALRLDDAQSDERPPRESAPTHGSRLHEPGQKLFGGYSNQPRRTMSD